MPVALLPRSPSDMGTTSSGGQAASSYIVEACKRGMFVIPIELYLDARFALDVALGVDTVDSRENDELNNLLYTSNS